MQDSYDPRKWIRQEERKGLAPTFTYYTAKTPVGAYAMFVDGSFVLQTNYVNMGTVACVIVARIKILSVETHQGEYAAYMGGTANSEFEEQTVQEVARHGIKIGKELAEYLFRRHLDYFFPEYKIEWRA
jgi:hypothetical protein